MKLPLDISSSGLVLPQVLEQHIHEQAQNLASFFSHIIHCRVNLTYRISQPHPLCVFIHMTVPGRCLVTTHNRTENLYAAINEAFKAARLQLSNHARQVNHPPQDSLTGLGPAIISSLDREQGYGQIKTRAGKTLYFDEQNVLHNAFNQLHPGMKVRFIENQASHAPSAKMLSPL